MNPDLKQRFLARRQRFLDALDEIRAEANAILARFELEDDLSLAQIGSLEGLRLQRQSVFAAYQEVEDELITALLDGKKTGRQEAQT